MYLLGAVTLLTEGRRIRCSRGKKIAYSFTFPFFVFSFGIAMLVAVFGNIEWKPIKHSVALSIGDMGSVSPQELRKLRKKQKAMKKLMGNLGKVRPVIGMENPWHYRNKAISTFAEGPGRQLISGIYARGSHYVIPVKTCLLHHPALDEAVRAVRKAARLCKYKPYDEDRKTGLIAMYSSATAF